MKIWKVSVSVALLLLALTGLASAGEVHLLD